MQVVIQDRTNQLYYKGEGQWTPEIAEAADFQEVIRAFDFVLVSHLSNLDVLMDFGDPKYDVRISATH
jgi:hypothetical protein